jgi:hypothetical protein
MYMVESTENKSANFYAEIVETNGVLRITIPKMITEIYTMKVGDKIKVSIEKVE